MKKVRKLLVTALCVTMGASVLAACGGDNNGGGNGGNNDPGKITVTYYDATGTNTPSAMTVLKTVKIDKGSKAESYTPTKADGYEFVDWFATPSKSHKFDFNEELESNVSIYAGFSKYVADTRDFYIIGAGTSNVLIDGWGKINENHKFTKAANKNEYTLTLDLRTNDQFTIVSNDKYYNKHGAGYLTTMTLGTQEVFAGQGSPYDDSYKGANIVVKYDGNYTLKMTTYPNEDYYNTEGEGYTEATKEIYMRNPYDTIEWTRNGDCEHELDIVTDYYIKGESITGWKDMYNPATMMTPNQDRTVYTLGVYLKEGDKVVFTSTNTVGDQVSVGADYLRHSNLDDTSKALFDESGDNMVVKTAGKYTFTYTVATKKLSATREDGTVVAADYYLDGTFAEGVTDWSGYCFNSAFKFTEKTAGSGIYELKNITMKADSQFIIQAFKAGSTERGEWGTDGYNGLGNYNYKYMLDEAKAFEAFDAKTNNFNIKVKTAGTYDITFDSYAKMITVTAHTAA